MKQLPTLSKLGLNLPEAGFQYLMDNLRPSLKLWDYFVNWEKVFSNTRALEVHLNLWNYLLGKDDFDTEFELLLSEHPEIVKAIPSMVVRDGAHSTTYAIVRNLQNLGAQDLLFDFSSPADTPAKRLAALSFIRGSGLDRLFNKDGVKNLVDYVLGVEAGLDSNGRKNRSGASMEAVCRAFLSSFADEKGLELMEQATAPKILKSWGFDVPVDKSSRRFDFALSDKKKLVLIEVNFYGGGGSKLKATAGEYKGLHSVLAAGGFEFIWITDGEGWRTTERPLREAFDLIDHVWNLKMLNSGLLGDIFP